ncbi:transposase [Candidatus Pacearchaeota archaeon]|nr:transposase [Candidatus Pacearchaeota archaeon]
MEDFRAYSEIQKKLRKFFSEEKNFVEVPTQSRLSILAACEDPDTLVTVSISGVKWPLPQTGQMWLEHELLKNPSLPGVFCVTTSYRNEPNPIKGRHDIVFPMFEFESHGTIKDLEKLERELLFYLGFKDPTRVSYESACEKYGVRSIEDKQEEALCGEYGTVMLHTFPQRTHPFWNMKHERDGFYNKIDVLLGGMETIGSAERSTNVDEMFRNFMTVSDGKYKQKLFDEFGEERVMEELDEYLALPMISRYGGGMGQTRLAKAMRKEGLLD